jgi:L-2-hydroxyglutarate oxidase LhgO
MDDRVDCVVVGAGVIGLAVARKLALSGREVIVIEAEAGIGTGTSSRNSEVIHAGIYYPVDSLKARLCVAGKIALYEYCRSHGVPHQRIGKLIVAVTEAELKTLAQLRNKAAANGVTDLTFLSAAEVKMIEPEIASVGALFSPSTGIIDSHQLMLAYQGEAEAAGAMIAFTSPVTATAVEAGGFRIETGGDAPVILHSRWLVNAAGLQARKVGARIHGLDPATVPPGYYLKGNYFTLPGRSPFRHLIYPAPVVGGLGTHVTLDLGGQVRFGPDTEPTAGLDYRVDPARAESFYAAIRRYYPALRDGTLNPGYAGIRPKLGKPGDVADFMIQGPAAHGIPGLINLYGIESPGLTASLAIADHVAALLQN